MINIWNEKFDSQGGCSVDFKEIPPLLRALIVTDGTVTKFLESYLFEPMEVICLSQESFKAKEDIPALDTLEGDAVLERKIIIKGVKSKKIFVYAESLIRTDRLGKELQSDLLNGNLGIGEILRDRRMETYREVISCEFQSADEYAKLIDVKPEERLLSRTYMIFSRQSPIMLITEKFPEQIYIDIERRILVP